MKKAEDNLKQWEEGRSKLTESVHTTSLGVNTQRGKAQAIRSQIGELTRTGTTCPTCGQSLKNKEGIESRIATLTADLDRESEDLSKAQVVLDQRKKAQSDFEAQYLDAKGKWDIYIREVRASVQATFDEVEKGSAGFSNLIAAIGNSIGLAQQRVDRHHSTINRLEESTKDLQKEMTLAESSVARSDERRKLAEKDLADSRVTYQGATDRFEQTKRTLALWVYWRDSIPNLRAAAMEEILVYLNDRIGEYMSEFSSGVMGMEVYQVPYGKKSKIKVNLRTSGGTYEMSSGGERRRIDLAVYLALSDLLHVASGVQCNVLVADEIMDGLSPEGVKKFSEILRKKANNGMCVLVVSHNPAVRQIIEYDSIITVEKRNDRAKLRLDIPAVQEGRRIVETEGLVSV
jgi:DNA repair exonuclease SbcCD ATPase subunit